MANWYKPRYKISYVMRTKIWAYKGSRLRKIIDKRGRVTYRRGRFHRCLRVLKNMKWMLIRRGLGVSYNMFSFKHKRHQRIITPKTRFKSHLYRKKAFIKFFGKIDDHNFKVLYKNFFKQKRLFKLLNFINALETRLDIIVYRMKILPTIFSAHQFIRHQGVLLNNQLVTFPSLKVKKGDIISFQNPFWEDFLMIIYDKLNDRLHREFLNSRRFIKKFKNLYDIKSRSNQYLFNNYYRSTFGLRLFIDKNKFKKLKHSKLILKKKNWNQFKQINLISKYGINYVRSFFNHKLYNKFNNQKLFKTKVYSSLILNNLKFINLIKIILKLKNIIYRLFVFFDKNKYISLFIFKLYFLLKWFINKINNIFSSVYKYIKISRNINILIKQLVLILKLYKTNDNFNNKYYILYKKFNSIYIKYKYNLLNNKLEFVNKLFNFNNDLKKLNIERIITILKLFFFFSTIKRTLDANDQYFLVVFPKYYSILNGINTFNYSSKVYEFLNKFIKIDGNPWFENFVENDELFDNLTKTFIQQIQIFINKNQLNTNINIDLFNFVQKLLLNYFYTQTKILIPLKLKKKIINIFIKNSNNNNYSNFYKIYFWNKNNSSLINNLNIKLLSKSNDKNLSLIENPSKSWERNLIAWRLPKTNWKLLYRYKFRSRILTNKVSVRRLKRKKSITIREKLSFIYRRKRFMRYNKLIKFLFKTSKRLRWRNKYLTNIKQNHFWYVPSYIEFDFNTLRGILIKEPTESSLIYSSFTTDYFKSLIAFYKRLGK